MRYCIYERSNIIVAIYISYVCMPYKLVFLVYTFILFLLLAQIMREIEHLLLALLYTLYLSWRARSTLR